LKKALKSLSKKQSEMKNRRESLTDKNTPTQKSQANLEKDGKLVKRSIKIRNKINNK